MIWGGEEDCRHQWVTETGELRYNQGYGSDFMGDSVRARADEIKGSYSRAICSICGAWKGAYGLEPTLEMYIQHTIDILRAIRRVLRKDGVVFWNIGDSYVTSSPGTSEMEPVTWSESGQLKKAGMTRTGRVSGLKPKDLCLIPFRVAIAAQEDGWWVRSIIVWDKPNPMPESADDRPTTSHEYILMLTKSAKYYWDGMAVRVPLSNITLLESEYPYGGQSQDGWQDAGAQDASGVKRRITQAVADGKLTGCNIRSVWTFPTEASGLEMCLKCKTVYDSAVYQRLPSKVVSKGGQIDKEARDRPLESPIHPYRGDGWGEQAIEGREQERKVKVCRCGASDWLSHFATFPEKLPETCIKAATPEVGCCSRCGAPWERVIEKGEGRARQDTKWAPGTEYGPSPKSTLDLVPVRGTIGWQPTCNCNADKVPSIVLDPMAGSGRVGKVAKELGRKSILIDTSEDYCRLAKRRIEVVPLPMFAPMEESYTKAPDWF